VEELASVAIWAIRCCVELYAGLSLVVGRQVHFFHKFMISMSEGAFILEFAFSKEFPVSTHFSLVLNLILSDEILPLLFGGKMLLGLFYSGFLEVFVGRLQFSRGGCA
jgi:hypothetical protein